ncbi:MAG: hypothetical protein H6744_13265 [Deltaproteobacteria bacterium]|nr:hypothetical protein [Deltaproteobacteria bacterium]
MAFCVILYLGNGDAAKPQLKKLLRAAHRRPAIAAQLVARGISSTLGAGQATGIAMDMERFARVSAKIGQGIYFYEHGCTYGGKLAAISPMLRDRKLRLEPSYIDVARDMDRLLAGSTWKGANQQVFAYQLMTPDGRLLMRLRFYDGFDVMIGGQPRDPSLRTG